MTPDQVRSARTLLAEPDHSVTSIAKLLGVSRSTIYKYVPELRSPAVPAGSAPAELPAAARPAVSGTADPVLSMPKPSRTAACPTCGYHPLSKHELQLHREGLETVWLLPDPEQPGTAVVERWHCERCQPHRARIIMCGLCSSTVMLGGDLAADEPAEIPGAAVLWLVGHGWSSEVQHWICGDHSTER